MQIVGHCCHPIRRDLGTSKRKLDDRGPSSLKSGMASPLNPSAWKKERHERWEHTKRTPLIVVAVLFIYLACKMLWSTLRTFWGSICVLLTCWCQCWTIKARVRGRKNRVSRLLLRLQPSLPYCGQLVIVPWVGIEVLVVHFVNFSCMCGFCKFW